MRPHVAPPGNTWHHFALRMASNSKTGGQPRVGPTLTFGTTILGTNKAPDIFQEPY